MLLEFLALPEDVREDRPRGSCLSWNGSPVMTNRSRLGLTGRREATDQVPRITPKNVRVLAGPWSSTASEKWSEGRAFLCAAPGPAAPICAALVALVMIGRPWPPACCDDHRREQGNQDRKPLGACPNICSCSRMAAGFRWALAFSASAQPYARTIPLNLPRRCRSDARSSKDCGSSISVATRPTLSPGLATETCGFLART